MRSPAPSQPAASDPDPDGDGILAPGDACPAAPGLPPDGCPPRDTDGDGLPDDPAQAAQATVTPGSTVDRCAELPGPHANGGCPDTDQDRDGEVDRRDLCPAVPGHPAHRGCPAPDRDRDAIADAEDRCPERAEVWNGKRDDDGCPDPGAALVYVDRDRIALVPGRWFRSSGKLATRGREALATAGAVLAAVAARQARIELVAPRSAADSAGQARAQLDAVRAALVRAAPGVVIEGTLAGWPASSLARPDEPARLDIVFR